MILDPSDPDVSMADLHDRPSREHQPQPAQAAGRQTPHESGVLVPCQPGEYHVRILRTPSMVGNSLKLLIPNQVRHDTPVGIVESVPADNPLRLSVGDHVILAMRQGGYGFTKSTTDDESVKKYAQAHPHLTYKECLEAMESEQVNMDSKYLIHPGTLMFVDAKGRNHFMVPAEDILVRIEKEPLV